ncbi:hypothetical protein KKA15_00090 [Patescibacteria group bacterium]|nr:hypothetical protein [Patescibacteria group bacterium]
MLKILVNFSTALTGIVSFILGVYTLYRNPKGRANQMWFLTSIAIVIWNIGYLISTNSQTEAVSAQWVYLTYCGVLLIPIFSMHFVISFLHQEKRKKYLLVVSYVITLLSFVLLYKTDFIIEGTFYTSGFGFNEDPGKYFWVFLIYFFSLAIYSTYLLAKSYWQSDGIIKKQSLCLLIAYLIGFTGGGTNYLTGTLGIFPYGQMLVFLFPIIITYGIFLKKY